MRASFSKSIKKQVAHRAGYQCEYCLLSESVSFYNFHLDHIRSVKHGGLTILENLAYCCPDCNFYKGSDIATYSANEEYFVRFFNPRTDTWGTHFFIQDAGYMVKRKLVFQPSKYSNLTNLTDLFSERN